MMNTDHEHTPIEGAAKWLAENGPGLQALNECKQCFGLTGADLPEICVAAARIRREAHGLGVTFAHWQSFRAEHKDWTIKEIDVELIQPTNSSPPEKREPKSAPVAVSEANSGGEA